MNFIGFIVLSVLTVGSAVFMLWRRNPVESALALAVNLVSIAGFYLLLHAQFIALLQVIVYAGAIMVLILFVIMLLNLPDDATAQRAGFFQFWLGLGLVAVLAAMLGMKVFLPYTASFPEPAAGFGTVSALGNTLFTDYFYPFEAISLLLVVAMIGAVLLAKRRI